jgi:hypothetical protein
VAVTRPTNTSIRCARNPMASQPAVVGPTQLLHYLALVSPGSKARDSETSRNVAALRKTRSGNGVLRAQCDRRTTRTVGRNG